jgi:NTP pyrophosphatase (non-canonical NTP hydrolase)
MNINQYQYDAMKTRLPSANEDYSLLGFVGEVGELYSLLAKSIRDGKDLDTEMVKKELGDCLWFIAAIATDFGFTLEDVAEVNLTKLNKRKTKGTLTGSGDER